MCDVSLINASLVVKDPYIPIGPLIIVSELEKAGFEVEFIDCQLIKDDSFRDHNKIAQLILSTKSNIVCIGVFANSLPLILKAIEIVKKENDSIKIVLGGPGVSKVPDKIFNLSPIDIIVRGEGEISTPKVIQHLKNNMSLSPIKGITYRNGDKIVHTPDQECLKDINVYPVYEHIRFEDYKNKATIITSRGCAYDCIFCAKPIWEKGVTYRSLDNVFEEINLIKDKVNRIYFCDDAFIVNKERLFEFCERYKRSGINIPWECTGRIGCMDEHILEKLQESGCETLYLGIESASNEVLHKLNKKITIEQSNKEIKIAKKYIKKVYTSYIWGFPFESLADFNETIFNYINDASDEQLNPVITLATPFFASKLYEENKDRLIFLEDNKYNGSTMKIKDQNVYEEIRSFILDNKDIFPSFFYIDHDSYHNKKLLIDKLLVRKGAIT